MPPPVPGPKKATAREWDLKCVTFGPPPRGDKPKGLRYFDRFEKLCDHIGLRNLHTAYMVESPYAHASALNADRHFELDDRGRTRLHDSPYPRAFR